MHTRYFITENVTCSIVLGGPAELRVEQAEAH